MSGWPVQAAPVPSVGGSPAERLRPLVRGRPRRAEVERRKEELSRCTTALQYLREASRLDLDLAPFGPAATSTAPEAEGPEVSSSTVCRDVLCGVVTCCDVLRGDSPPATGEQR